MAQYVVTGAAGFIGARTSELLVKAGHSVVGSRSLILLKRKNSMA